MIEVRFHGRGGQGAKIASRILGRCGFLAGLHAQRRFRHLFEPKRDDEVITRIQFTVDDYWRSVSQMSATTQSD